jgi:hypothetical protein
MSFAVLLALRVLERRLEAFEPEVGRATRDKHSTLPFFPVFCGSTSRNIRRDAGAAESRDDHP